MATPIIDVEIFAPEHRNVQFDAREVILPGAEGVFMVQPGHTPLLASLSPGVVIAMDGQKHEDFHAVSGGFAEVRDNRVVILTQSFEHGEEIDLERAEAARERAREWLRFRDAATDIRRAELALARAMARIKAHNKEGY